MQALQKFWKCDRTVGFENVNPAIGTVDKRMKPGASSSPTADEHRLVDLARSGVGCNHSGSFGTVFIVLL